jgi:Uma2 family endonuclease
MAIDSGITIEEFESLPDALARNHELVNGELVDVSGNTGYHNRIGDRLIKMLSPLVEEPNLGMIISEPEFDFNGNAHGPDVALIGAAKVHLIDLNRRVQLFVPDPATEIVSQNDKICGPSLTKRRRLQRQISGYSEGARYSSRLEDGRASATL